MLIWRTRLTSLTTIAIHLGDMNLNRNVGNIALKTMFAKTDDENTFKRILDLANKNRSAITRQNMMHRSVAIFRLTSLNYVALKYTSANMTAIYHALLESQDDFIQARRNLLCYDEVFNLRRDINHLIGDMTGAPNLNFMWWDRIEIKNADIIRYSRDVNTLTSELAITARLAEEKTVLQEFRRKLETNKLLVINPQDPAAKRRVSKLTSTLIDQLLEVGDFSLICTHMINILSS